MNIIPLIILSSFIAFQSKTPKADTIAIKADTVHHVGYTIRPEHLWQFEHSKKESLSEEERKDARGKRLKVLYSKQNQLRSGSAPAQEIPMQEAFTPSGALTYNIPIATIAGHTFAPSISLAYNSQAGNGIAGFGWNIAGLSAISLRNKNLYYDGTIAAANYQDKTNAVWTLDGEPLVQNEDISSFPGYQYQTAKGRIMVKKYMSGSNLYSFDAMFPDGRMAEYGGELALTQKRISYPISQMQNLSGNVILFYYNTSDYNNPVISEILYGGTCDDNCPGRLVFTYQSGRTDTPARYVAGAEVRQERLLKSITSYEGNEEICTYNFTHTIKDSVYILTRIDCSRGNSQLNPLLFDYGIEEYEDAGGIAYDIDKTSMMANGYDNTVSGTDYLYLRGKFLAGDYNDGIISLISLSNYKAIGFGYGSEYPSDSKIFITPCLDEYRYGTFTRTIETGAGFQTIEAVDVDGDAADEIVKVNVSGARNNYTDLAITVLKIDQSTGYIDTLHIHNVSIYGSRKNTFSSVYSPEQRAYYFGDFIGNGKCYLLTFSYSKNYDDISQSSHSALIDLESGSVLSDEVITTCKFTSAVTVFAMDIDGDGKTEFCDAYSDRTDIWRANASGHFSKQESLSVLKSTLLKDSDHPLFFLDHNGDGYMDFLRAPSTSSLEDDDSNNTWVLYIGTGTRFVGYGSNVTTRIKDIRIIQAFPPKVETVEDKFFFTDITRDGIADMIRIREGSICVFQGRPNGFSGTPMPVSSSLTTTDRGIVPQNIANIGGIGSLICVEGNFVHVYSGYMTSPEKRIFT